MCVWGGANSAELYHNDCSRQLLSKADSVLQLDIRRWHTPTHTDTHMAAQRKISVAHFKVYFQALFVSTAMENPLRERHKRAKKINAQDATMWVFMLSEVLTI